MVLVDGTLNVRAGLFQLAPAASADTLVSVTLLPSKLRVSVVALALLKPMFLTLVDTDTVSPGC